MGQDLKAEEVFGTVEAVKTVSDLFMPVSGKVLEVNPALDGDPASVNKDPYGAGWMVKVKMSDPGEATGLLSADAYTAIVG